MKSNSLNLGTRRGLSQCAAPNGTFCMLALDHRQALIKALFRYGDQAVDEGVIFKKDVIRALAPYSTAFLLDPVIGAGPAIADNTLSGAAGLIVSVEETGYAGPSHARVSRLPADWSVEKIKKMGASAVKFLVYFNAEAETAEPMKELTSQIAEECIRYDIPLFLEILTYSAVKGDETYSGKKRSEVILRAVEELTALGGDVLKVEFPVGANENRRVWEDGCKSISQASPIPWVLLSAGVEGSLFLQQTAVACAAGASGILAGRSVWKEALTMERAERTPFLQTTSKDRLQELYDVCTVTAKPYFEFYTPAVMNRDWLKDYPGF